MNLELLVPLHSLQLSVSFVPLHFHTEKIENYTGTDHDLNEFVKAASGTK